jgi:alpha-glucosidase (family GH31 glycosyl hydrolase)
MVLHMALSPHPAHHRFPVWWTGDDKSMAYSVQSMVDLGVTQLKPYVMSDCGGDGRTDADGYIRWIQHCALGTILRIHGGPPDYPAHQPWSYDTYTTDAVRAVIQMRYVNKYTSCSKSYTRFVDLKIGVVGPFFSQ